MPGWTYLILSERGEVYLGATSHLRNRLRSHNSSRNDGWTRGRRWHLLAVRKFTTMAAALRYEYYLKKNHYQKIKWQLASIPRAVKIQQRLGYAFSPIEWPILHSRRRKKMPQTSNAKSGLA